MIGYWVFPTIVTLIAFGLFWRWASRQEKSSGYGAIGDGLAFLIMFAIALVVSLIAWLVYAFTSLAFATIATGTL